jgi:hypothetical protein
MAACFSGFLLLEESFERAPTDDAAQKQRQTQQHQPRLAGETANDDGGHHQQETLHTFGDGEVVLEFHDFLI